MKDPCYSVPFRCYHILFMFFASEYHGYSRTCPCYFVSFRCYYHLFAVFCIGASRIFTDVSVLFRAIPLLSYFVCCFLHRSITE